MKHHVVISEEVIEEQGFREGREEAVRGVVRMGGESSNRRGDQPKEYYEKKTRVTKPIALGDLFRPRSIRPRDPESEVRRVLLYGNPGSGKTCITKAVAHRWASGEMAHDLDAVYVVPVRVLNRGEYNGRKWTRLEGAISQICFAGSRHAFDHEDLVSQVEQDLDDPSTMLMVDGLDEANDLALELLSTVWERSCKVLLLSRPYNMRNVETRVDVQVECLGFNDQQLREYVEGELSEEEAPRLIRSLGDSGAMWEMAHVPVTAHILCSLSKEHGTAIEGRGKRASVFQVYNDMANYVWKRFKTKPAATNVKRSDLFDDLERIAFESLRRGLILIPPRLVTRYATSTDAAGTFKESGLLLLVMEGREYQFPHLTFQEYFAGRHIARGLRNSGSAEEDRVLEFIREEKYNRKHALTLSFAMHAYAEGRGKSALQKMLSIVDEDPIEVLGIQHFFLRLRVLEAILKETDEGDLKDFLNDEQAVALAESARHLLERTIDDVLMRETVVKEFQQMSGVLEGFSQVLRNTIDVVETMLASAHKLRWKEMAKITDALKLARHSAKQSNALVQFVLQRAEESDGCCDPEEHIRRLGCVAEKMPKHAGEVLPTLAKGCVDEDWYVRSRAMDAIGKVVAAAPQHAGEVLPTLAKGCVDEYSNVRLSAMWAIGRVVAAAPQHAGEFLPTLAKGCVDEDLSVRYRAVDAIDSVVAAAPQHAGEVLPTLAKGCVDEYLCVRYRAVDAIDSVVAAAPQHAGEVLPTLAKGCVDEDSNVRLSAMWAMGKIVAAAPQHAGEFLPTLAKGCVDEDLSVRYRAVDAIDSVVAAAPQHAGEVLPTLAKGCVDEYLSVRYRAVEAIGRVVAAAPQHVGEFLPTLAKVCFDEDLSVRYRAVEAIDSVVPAAPQRAGEVLPTLAKWCVDKRSDVRLRSMEAIGRVVAAAPQHTGEFLPTLAKGCFDEDLSVRYRAVEAIDSVVPAAPQRAGEVLPTLAKWCVDKRSDVRLRSMEAIGRVVAAAPQHTGEFLPTLAKGCVDEDSYVRSRAMEAVGRVVAAAPQHASEVLPTLAKGCVDEDSNVRLSAMNALNSMNPEEIVVSTMSTLPEYKAGNYLCFVRYPFTLDSPTKQKMVPFVLHATSSQEIGKWSKDHVDLVVLLLRREFDVKFSGLLEHLERKG